MQEIHFTKKDFDIDWFSGSGAGGQHRNKHQNCCRITHIPSGLRCNGTASRSRVVNQKYAFHNLAKMILAYYSPTENREITREVIRNYNEFRNEVHDKLSGLKMPYTVVVHGCKIGPMIEARLRGKHG